MRRTRLRVAIRIVLMLLTLGAVSRVTHEVRMRAAAPITAAGCGATLR